MSDNNAEVFIQSLLFAPKQRSRRSLLVSPLFNSWIARMRKSEL